MSSAYNRINRLRMQGLTWDALGRKLAAALDPNKTIVARNTLRSLQNLPHYKPGKDLISAINKVHDQHNPSPFPSGVNSLMNLCRNLMREHKHNHLANEGLKNIERHTEEQLKLADQPDLIACRLHWILGNINQFLMRAARLNKETQTEIGSLQLKAINNYQSAIKYVNPNAHPLEHYKLQHNVFVCFVNAVEEKQRNDNKTLIKQLSSITYIDAAQQVLNTEPFQWETARNGLLYASISKNRTGVANFFEALIIANFCFADLAYKPLNCDSIVKDPSLRWAVNNILTPNFVQTIVDKFKRAKPLAH